MKFIGRSEEIPAYGAERIAREPEGRELKPTRGFDRELFNFGLEVIALIGAVYVVHLFIHKFL